MNPTTSPPACGWQVVVSIIQSSPRDGLDRRPAVPGSRAWFHRTLAISAVAVRELNRRDATDAAIFEAARDANAIVLTKDSDFVRLLERRGPPPEVVWLTCGREELDFGSFRQVCGLIDDKPTGPDAGFQCHGITVGIDAFERRQRR